LRLAGGDIVQNRVEKNVPRHQHHLNTCGAAEEEEEDEEEEENGALL